MATPRTGSGRQQLIRTGPSGRGRNLTVAADDVGTRGLDETLEGGSRLVAGRRLVGTRAHRVGYELVRCCKLRRRRERAFLNLGTELSAQRSHVITNRRALRRLSGSDRMARTEPPRTHLIIGPEHHRARGLREALVRERSCHPRTARDARRKQPLLNGDLALPVLTSRIAESETDEPAHDPRLDCALRPQKTVEIGTHGARPVLISLELANADGESRHCAMRRDGMRRLTAVLGQGEALVLGGRGSRPSELRRAVADPDVTTPLIAAVARLPHGRLSLRLTGTAGADPTSLLNIGTVGDGDQSGRRGRRDARERQAVERDRGSGPVRAGLLGVVAARTGAEDGGDDPLQDPGDRRRSRRFVLREGARRHHEDAQSEQTNVRVFQSCNLLLLQGESLRQG